MLKSSSTAAMAALVFASTAPAHAAAEKCAGGYRDFLSTMSPFVDKMDETEIPVVMRKGIGVFDACTAGDAYAAATSWDEIVKRVQQHVKAGTPSK